MKKVLAAALALAMNLPGLGAAPVRTPILRYTVYLVGGEPTADLTLVSRKYGGARGPYGDILSYALTDAAGRVLVEDDLALRGRRTLKVPAGTGPLWVIEVRPGQNYAVVESRAPLGMVASKEAPLHLVRESGRLYFLPKPKAAKVRLVVRARSVREGARLVVRDHRNQIVLDTEGDFDDPRAFDLTIPPRNGPNPWSVEVLRPKDRRLVLDDVTLHLEGDLTPLFCVRSEWLAPLAPLVERPVAPGSGLPGPPPGAIAVLSPALKPPEVLARERPRVRAPVYYMLDYGRHHLDNPGYVKWISDFPPDLLHFGKDVPMTHLWGPIAAVGGENQAHGRNRSDIRRLSPAEVGERIAKLRSLTKALRAAGVKWVMPYISAVTVAGDPKKRIGFFEFFDHWQEYRAFGLGPRPESDPLDWMARRADGSFHTFGKFLQPPYYGGLYRYVACTSHPDWRRWLQHVTRLVAEAGYDGAFPDNSTPYRCYAPHCQAGFRRAIEKKYPPDLRAELFGTADIRKIALPTDRSTLLGWRPIASGSGRWPRNCGSCATRGGR